MKWNVLILPDAKNYSSLFLIKIKKCQNYILWNWGSLIKYFTKYTEFEKSYCVFLLSCVS